MLTMFEFYGASELSFVSFLCDDSDKDKLGSVGKPFHNVEIQIRNDHLDESIQLGKLEKFLSEADMIFYGYIHPESRYHSIDQR